MGVLEGPLRFTLAAPETLRLSSIIASELGTAGKISSKKRTLRPRKGGGRKHGVKCCSTQKKKREMGKNCEPPLTLATKLKFRM